MWPEKEYLIKLPSEDIALYECYRRMLWEHNSPFSWWLFRTVCGEGGRDNEQCSATNPKAHGQFVSNL